MPKITLRTIRTYASTNELTDPYHRNASLKKNKELALLVKAMSKLVDTLNIGDTKSNHIFKGTEHLKKSHQNIKS